MNKYLWDHRKTAPLEKIIFRVLKYGRFEEIRKLYCLYPEETYEIVEKYDFRRGVRFWLKRFKNAKNDGTCIKGTEGF